MSKNLISLVLLSFLLLKLALQSSAQLPDTWTQKKNFSGLARYGAAAFSIGSKAYLGTGNTGANRNDFWEYDPTTDSWSQKADFGGSARALSVAFSIGVKGYLGTGRDDSGAKLNDFWEYDVASNSWSQKANFGGLARSNGVGFSIESKGYLGTGLIDATTRVNDFWEYDPATDVWTQKSNVGGSVRASPVGFTIRNKGYIGTGNSGLLLKDFWEYDPNTDIWIQKADFGGVARFQAIGLGTGTSGYIGLGDIGGSYTNDFWEYNPDLDSWTKKNNFGGDARIMVSGFSISNKVFVGLGFDAFAPQRYNDFWEYTPCVQPALILEPISQSLTYGSSTNFIVTASDTVSYQWQEDTGSGFTNIINSGIYSGATNDTLNISLPTVEMTGYKYRCVVTGDCSLTATSDGKAALVVTSAPLIITAENKEKCYDGAIYNEAYTVTYDGFVNGEDQGTLNGLLIFNGTATTSIIAGNYSIEPSGYTSTNYAIEYVNGTLVIKPTPDSPIITQSGDSLISSITIGNQWFKDGIKIIGSNDYVHVATSDGIYYTVITEDNCASNVSNSISILTASLDQTSTKLFDIYPNPNNGIFSIKYKTASSEVYNMEIFNNQGSLILNQKNVVLDGNNANKIILNNPIPGMYTVVLTNKAKRFVKKLLITR